MVTWWLNGAVSMGITGLLPVVFLPLLGTISFIECFIFHTSTMKKVSICCAWSSELLDRHEILFLWTYLHTLLSVIILIYEPFYFSWYQLTEWFISNNSNTDSTALIYISILFFYTFNVYFIVHLMYLSLYIWMYDIRCCERCTNLSDILLRRYCCAMGLSSYG